MKLRLKLKPKLIIGIVSLILITNLILTAINIIQFRDTKYNDFRATVINMSSMLAGAFTLKTQPDKDFIKDYFQRIIRLTLKDKDVRVELIYLLYRDRNKQPYAWTFNFQKIKKDDIKILDHRGFPLTENKEQIRAKLNNDISVIGKNIKEFKIPIVVNRKQRGILSVAYSLTFLNTTIINILVRNIGITIIIVLGAVIFSYFFVNSIVNPFFKLIKGMKKVEDGDYTVKVDIHKTDEIGYLANTFNSMAKGLWERERIKSTFQRYMSKQVADVVLKNMDNINFKGEKKVVTILFSDIRGFTGTAENMSPDEVVETLNEYFNVMVEEILEENGIIDKFIGDAIMAVWGIPIANEMDALHAVRAAYRMQQTLEKLNQNRVNQNKKPISMGIGINTGEVIAGNIGSIKRMEYTVIGDDVNLAERLEANAKHPNILISESTYRLVKEYVTIKEEVYMKVKGKVDEVKVYKINTVDFVKETEL